MADPLARVDAADHIPRVGGTHCACGSHWPCVTLALAVEVERLRAENERLREWKSLHSRITAPDEPNWFEEACSQKARADRLERAMQAVRGLHHPVPPTARSGGFCDGCSWVYPCPTLDILDAALGGERDE